MSLETSEFAISPKRHTVLFYPQEPLRLGLFNYTDNWITEFLHLGSPWSMADSSLAHRQ